jgi:hypothetical protein
MFEETLLANAIAQSIGFGARAFGIVLWEIFIGSLLVSLVNNHLKSRNPDADTWKPTAAICLLAGGILLAVFALRGAVDWLPLLVGNTVLLSVWGLIEALGIGIIRNRNRKNWVWISMSAGVLLFLLALLLLFKAYTAQQEMPRHTFIGIGFACFFTGILLLGLYIEDAKQMLRRINPV